MNLIPKDGEVLLHPNLFNTEECGQYFNSLTQEIDWNQEPITIFGKKVMQPRLTALYGDPFTSYQYSGIRMKAKAWNPMLLDIKKRIEAIAKTKFNIALLNLYRNENDSMGWHRDNEKELGLNPIIGSISFGETRVFKLRHYFEKQIKTSIELSNGSFLLMRGATQHHWEHSIPKSSKTLGTRINLTFRTLL